MTRVTCPTCTHVCSSVDIAIACIVLDKNVHHGKINIFSESIFTIVSVKRTELTHGRGLTSVIDQNDSEIY